MNQELKLKKRRNEKHKGNKPNKNKKGKDPSKDKNAVKTIESCTDEELT